MTDARAKPSPRKTRGRSTGPRSTSGKQRSARKAFKHGLSIPAMQTVLAAEVAELASKISGGNDELLEHAISIAEAQITLLRARRLRSELINRAVADPQFTSSKDSVRYIRFLGRLLRAEDTGRFGAALQREAPAKAPSSGTPAPSRSWHASFGSSTDTRSERFPVASLRSGALTMPGTA